MPCQCDKPQAHTRPSGTVICLQCERRIEAPEEKAPKA